MLENFFGALRGDRLMKSLVAHQHRPGAATGQALDEFDRKLSVARGLWPMRVAVEAQLRAKVFVHLV